MPEKPAVTPAEEARSLLRSMATPEFSKEMSAQIRSRRPLVYLVTSEEKRVLEFFRHYAVAAGYRTFCWDCYNGLLNVTDMQASVLSTTDPTDVCAVLDWIVKEATETHEGDGNTTADQFKGNIYLLWDFHRFLKPCTPEVERRLRTLSRMNSRTTVIMVAPTLETTPALEKEMAVLDFPFPSTTEINAAIDRTVDSVMEANAEACQGLREDTDKNRDAIAQSVNGLTMPEAEAAFARSVVMHRRFDIPTIIKEKQQIIRKTGVLEYFTPDVSMQDVGGLGNLLDWLKKRKKAFKNEARDYGLPTPKGVMIFGVPGSGKSLSAKATAAEYNMPLLRLDFGSLFGSYVGESERTARSAIKIAEAVAPCVLWCDEIEKGLSGFRSSGSTDSGTTSRVISTFLTWMQEKKAHVFVIATANQVNDIPPEFMRAGRFDEIFFADVPSRGERLEITKALLRRRKRDPETFDTNAIASSSDGYTGAEIEKAIDLALYEGFEADREIVTQDIITAFGKFQPISKVQADAIARMREWASERCVRANSPEASQAEAIVRKKAIDI